MCITKGNGGASQGLALLGLGFNDERLSSFTTFLQMPPYSTVQ